MKQWIGLFAIAAMALVGCGGGSSSGGGGAAPTTLTRERVKQVVFSEWRSLAQSVWQNAEWAGMRNGAGAAEGGGSFGVMPMFGGFLRHLAGISGAQGSGDDGSPPETRDDFYFDDFLGLWVQIQDRPGRWEMRFFEDEARTRPAGSAVSTYPADWESYPQTFESNYEYTAGALRGARGSYLMRLTDPVNGSMTYENTYADGSNDRGESTWDASGTRWSNRVELSDGAWYQHQGSWSADGSGSSSMSNSLGYRHTFRYNPDGSGSGTVEGPDPGLPARLTWDMFGNTTIRYADGTEEVIPSPWGFGDISLRPVGLP